MRKRKVRDIIIDLTSLLDVIMIILFGVMMIDSQKAKDAGLQSESLQDSLMAAENRLASYDYMKELVLVYNIELKNTAENSETMLIFGDNLRSISTPKKKKTQTDKNRRLEWTKAVNDLKMDLESYIQEELNGSAGMSGNNNPEDKFLYIFFTYNRGNVFQNDFESLDNTLRQIEASDESQRIRYRLKESE